MRDKERIPTILTQIERVWEENPDLRLGQLLCNVFHNEVALYYIEDKELVKKIEDYYSNLT